MIKASAPGKVILFGEHAVVYGQPALAVPVTQVQAEVRIDRIFSPGIRINAPNIQLNEKLDSLSASHPLAVTVRNTLAALDAGSLSGVSILIRSTIPVASGLGSGRGRLGRHHPRAGETLEKGFDRRAGQRAGL
jgi:mevalonate kinase